MNIMEGILFYMVPISGSQVSSFPWAYLLRSRGSIKQQLEQNDACSCIYSFYYLLNIILMVSYSQLLDVMRHTVRCYFFWWCAVITEGKKVSGKNHNWEKRTKVFRIILVINSSRMRMGRRTESTSRKKGWSCCKKRKVGMSSPGIQIFWNLKGFLFFWGSLKTVSGAF